MRAPWKQDEGQILDGLQWFTRLNMVTGENSEYSAPSTSWHRGLHGGHGAHIGGLCLRIWRYVCVEVFQKTPKSEISFTDCEL